MAHTHQSLDWQSIVDRAFVADDVYSENTAIISDLRAENLRLGGDDLVLGRLIAMHLANLAHSMPILMPKSEGAPEGHPSPSPMPAEVAHSQERIAHGSHIVLAEGTTESHQSLALLPCGHPECFEGVDGIEGQSFAATTLTGAKLVGSNGGPFRFAVAKRTGGQA